MARERSAMMAAAATAHRQARWLRLLGRKNTLTGAGPRYCTEAGHHDREAPGAVDHVRGGGVGIARRDALPDPAP